MATMESRPPRMERAVQTKWRSVRLLLISLLRIYWLRYWFVRLRYVWLRSRLKFCENQSQSVGKNTIAHNLSAFKNADAVFGCGGRMGLLIYPVVAYYSNFVINKGSLKVLIVGCRSEDDIFWMKSYGFHETYGLDLFSYSKHVLLGDIHCTHFDSGSFDVVLLGWMISYSSDPAAVMRECVRILKPGGLLGIGIEHNPKQDDYNLGDVRVNTLNSTADIVDMMDRIAGSKIVFNYDHENLNDFGVAVLLKIQCTTSAPPLQHPISQWNTASGGSAE